MHAKMNREQIFLGNRVPKFFVLWAWFNSGQAALILANDTEQQLSMVFIVKYANSSVFSWIPYSNGVNCGLGG